MGIRVHVREAQEREGVREALPRIRGRQGAAHQQQAPRYVCAATHPSETGRDRPPAALSTSSELRFLGLWKVRGCCLSPESRVGLGGDRAEGATCGGVELDGLVSQEIWTENLPRTPLGGRRNPGLQPLPWREMTEPGRQGRGWERQTRDQEAQTGPGTQYIRG